MLNLDGDCGIRALQVGAANNHTVHLIGAATGLCQRFRDRRKRHLGLQAEFFLATQWQVGAQTGRVEHADLVHHEAALDTRSTLDELGVGNLTLGQLASGNLGRVLLVPLLDGDGQRGNQLFVGDGERRGEQPGSGNDDTIRHDAIRHGRRPYC